MAFEEQTRKEIAEKQKTINKKMVGDTESDYARGYIKAKEEDLALARRLDNIKKLFAEIPNHEILEPDVANTLPVEVQIFGSKLDEWKEALERELK